MKTQSSDTHPDAERVQIELLRNATVAQRFGLVRSLTRTTRQLAWRAVQRVHPDANDDEVALLFAAHCYGPELAERLRADLARRAQR